MSEHRPDNWVVVKLPGYEGMYKVVGGWSGGYTTGDSWRVNSGISRVVDGGDYYAFYGYSGSTYTCHKSGYGSSMACGSILVNLKEAGCELLEDREDWTTLNSEINEDPII